MANTSSIQQQITAAATAAGIPPSLALAVAQVESNFNPNAVSPPNSNGTQDYGVFQINSSDAVEKDYGQGAATPGPRTTPETNG